MADTVLRLFWRLRNAIPSRAEATEAVCVWVAWHLPRAIVYWATVRAGVHATTGKWSREDPRTVTMQTIMQRWDD